MSAGAGWRGLTAWRERRARELGTDGRAVVRSAAVVFVGPDGGHYTAADVEADERADRNADALQAIKTAVRERYGAWFADPVNEIGIAFHGGEPALALRFPREGWIDLGVMVGPNVISVEAACAKVRELFRSRGQ